MEKLNLNSSLNHQKTMEEQRMERDNSGITLVSLVITIIILFILSSIAIYSGVGTIRSARLTKFTVELKMMQQKVNELYDSYTNNKSVIVNGIEYMGKGEYTTQTTDDGQTQMIKTKQGIQDIGNNLEENFSTSKLETIFSIEESGVADKEGYKYYDAETLQALGLENMEYTFFEKKKKRSIISTVGLEYDGKIYYTLDQVPDGVYNVEYNNTERN